MFYSKSDEVVILLASANKVFLHTKAKSLSQCQDISWPHGPDLVLLPLKIIFWVKLCTLRTSCVYSSFFIFLFSTKHHEMILCMNQRRSRLHFFDKQMKGWDTCTTCGDEGLVIVMKRFPEMFFLLLRFLLNSQSLMVACIIAMTDGDVGGELIQATGAIPLFCSTSVYNPISLFFFMYLFYLWRSIPATHPPCSLCS